MNRTHADHLDGIGYINSQAGGIGRMALLTAAEEKELARAIARGDAAAKDRLIRANLGLVAKIAREYLGRGIDPDDLIGEGNLGLIRAAVEFDPGFGTRFSTYASYWIRQAIRHAIINTTATIRLPAHMIGLMTKWRRLERRLCRERGCPPSADEVASLLGLSELQRGLVAKARNAGNLRLASSFADEGEHWSEGNSDDSPGSPGDALEAEEGRRELHARLDRLDERERAIVGWRFGLGGEAPQTLKEIGGRLGVTREWVRKIEIRALGKLGDGPAATAASGARQAPRAKAPVLSLERDGDGNHRRSRAKQAAPALSAAAR